MPVADALRRGPRGEIARDDQRLDSDHRVEHGEVDSPSGAGTLPFDESSENRPGAEQAGNDIGNGLADQRRRAFWRASDGTDAGHGLPDELIGRPPGESAPLAETQN